MNQTYLTDSAYFDHLLAVMDAANTRAAFTIPEPTITPYNPVYYPTQPTSLLSDITNSFTFNPFDQMFDFNLALSLPSTTPAFEPEPEPLYSGSKPGKQESVVPNPTPVLPEIVHSMTFDSVKPTFNKCLPPTTTSKPKSKTRKCGRKPYKQVVPKPRPKRATLGLQYSTFAQRLKILSQDPYVRAINMDENRILCSGCDRDIQLDNRRRRSLHLQNWKTHKSRCDGIKLDVDVEQRNELNYERNCLEFQYELVDQFYKFVI